MEMAITLSGEAQAYISRLENEVIQLKNSLQDTVLKFQKSEKEVITLQAKNGILEEKLRLALYRQFGRGTERFTGKDQLNLFVENLETGRENKAPEAPPVEVKGYERNKPGRKKLDEKIPRVIVEIDIDEEDKYCACGHKLEYIGYDISEKLIIIPEQVFVVQFHIKKFACKNCEGSGDEEKKAVRSGKIPGNIIPGGIATPELLSFVFTKKYCDYLPYYRQEAGFQRIGVSISRQDMSNWQMKIHEKIKPLIKLLKEELKKGEVMGMDETPVQVMNESGRDNRQLSYMWLARGGPPGKPVIIYEYHESRASENVLPFLEGFSGYLQSDGWGSYTTALKQRPDILHVGCWAHVRRKFYEALKAEKKGGAENPIAAEALSYIKGLYTIEKDLRGKLKDKHISGEKFVEERKNKCLSLLRGFYQWLLQKSSAVLGSSVLGNAVSYTLRQYPTLLNYLEHEELTPDNNGAERGIRPFVMGRKNWILCGSPEGATNQRFESSCALYSLIETAKENGHNPYTYLNSVFTKAADMKISDDWSCLLPWNLPRKNFASGKN
jgi:transposase